MGRLNAQCLSDLTLDEWGAGELDAAASAGVQAHLTGCARCSQRSSEFSQQRAAFLEQAPSVSAHAALLGRAPLPRARPRRALVWSGAALAAAAVAAVIALAPAAPITRGKGPATQLGFFVKRGPRVSRGVSGERVRPGDFVRFTYSSDRARYFALLSRDAGGARVYFPAAAEATRLRAGADVALDFSIELDASPGREDLYAVFCDTSFALEPLRAALAGAPDLVAPAGCRLERVTLEKELTR